jgi:hypothetical protein
VPPIDDDAVPVDGGIAAQVYPQVYPQAMM